MNTSDWKRLEDEKPDHGQKILFLVNGGHVMRATYCTGDVYVHEWWQPWDDPPKPDPFGEFWKNAMPTNIESARLRTPGMKEWLRGAWDAAVKWAREHKEEL